MDQEECTITIHCLDEGILEIELHSDQKPLSNSMIAEVSFTRIQAEAFAAAILQNIKNGEEVISSTTIHCVNIKENKRP